MNVGLRVDIARLRAWVRRKVMADRPREDAAGRREDRRALVAAIRATGGGR